MADERRPKLVLAVAPAVWSHALAAALRQAGVDDVITHESAQEPPPQRHGYDVAVVTELPEDVIADVVIRLPEPGHGGWVEAEGHRVPVHVNDVLALLKLLDRYVPGDRPRTDG